MSEPAAGPEAAGRRVVFLDAARCAAIALMVFAHVSDSLRLPSAWSGAFGTYYGYLRGFTAPVFFLVSGWAFSLATLPKVERFRRWGPELKKRLGRVLTLLAWGYALTLPWWAEGFPFSSAGEVWAPFFAIGVLQCVAVALLAAQGLVLVAPSKRFYAGLALLLSTGAVLLGPRTSWAEHLWLPLRGFFFAGAAQGGFPIAPHAAYFWLGSAAGALWLSERWTPRAMGFWLLGLGALGLWVGPKLGERTAPSEALFLFRLGQAALLLGLVSLFTSKLRGMPKALGLVARRPLTFYVGHMLLIWGVPFVPGLAHRVGPTLGPLGCALWAAGSLLAIYGVVAAEELLRARRAAGVGGESSSPPVARSA